MLLKGVIMENLKYCKSATVKIPLINCTKVNGYATTVIYLPSK